MFYALGYRETREFDILVRIESKLRIIYCYHCKQHTQYFKMLIAFFGFDNLVLEKVLLASLLHNFLTEQGNLNFHPLLFVPKFISTTF